jgi:alpha-galactosidase
MTGKADKVKIAYVGGGSPAWGPRLIRDIIFKKGMAAVDLEIALLDPNAAHARAIKRLFNVLNESWGVDRARIYATRDAKKALRGADFVLITISTGGLAAMRHDLEIPERYGIYHTVGDTAGPGGWARALRNIPVFADYAMQVAELAPGAFVLNYTNPMGVLTKVMSDRLGHRRVIGLCHGLFELYADLQVLFGLESEAGLKASFGGLNHFFWVLDFMVSGRNGYEELRKRLRGRTLAKALADAASGSRDARPHALLASELLAEYGHLTYTADRHTCEFFASYITDPGVMDRFGLVRTTVDDRQRAYERNTEAIREWTAGDRRFSKRPSRETAADIIAAITFDQGFTDVVNMANIGQIPNLPSGAVVETPGYVDASGASPLTVGPLPEPIRALCTPHAEVQLATVEAGLSGDLAGALTALAADPLCASLPVSDVKKMGMELLEANREYLPQFFGT